MHGRNWEKSTSILQNVRVSICAHLELAEELMPMDNLAAFFQKHEKYAQLVVQYPEARISKDSLERCAVEAYEKTFLGQELARSTHECMGKAGHGLFERSCSVARESSIIVFPRVSAEACLVAAYVMAKCEEAFGRLSWLLSTLTGIQATFEKKYGLTDFAFWVMYGSWSFCKACGSFTFNDKHFSERVYQDCLLYTSPSPRD